MHRFTEKQKQFIKDNVVGMTNDELTIKFNLYFGLNLTTIQIKSFKNNHHLKSGLNMRFKKGQQPFNKGLKQEAFMSLKGQINSRKTQFKKGNRPFNSAKIGEERMRIGNSKKSSYLCIKVCDGKKNNNWVPKHRLIYEKYYGPIPNGYKVIFADGDNTNFEINNLILVSPKEHLIMNKQKLRFNDAKLTHTGYLIAKVIAKYNEQ